MRLLHIFIGHRWHERSRVFNGVFNGPSEIPPYLTDRAHHGFTVILDACECGAQRLTELTGDHRR